MVLIHLTPIELIPLPFEERVSLDGEKKAKMVWMSRQTEVVNRTLFVYLILFSCLRCPERYGC